MNVITEFWIVATIAVVIVSCFSVGLIFLNKRKIKKLDDGIAGRQKEIDELRARLQREEPQ